MYCSTNSVFSARPSSPASSPNRAAAGGAYCRSWSRLAKAAAASGQHPQAVPASTPSTDLPSSSSLSNGTGNGNQKGGSLTPESRGPLRPGGDGAAPPSSRAGRPVHLPYPRNGWRGAHASPCARCARRCSNATARDGRHDRRRGDAPGSSRRWARAGGPTATRVPTPPWTLGSRIIMGSRFIDVTAGSPRPSATSIAAWRTSKDESRAGKTVNTRRTIDAVGRGGGLTDRPRGSPSRPVKFSPRSTSGPAALARHGPPAGDRRPPRVRGRRRRCPRARRGREARPRTATPR